MGGKPAARALYLGFPVVTKKRPGAEPVMGTQEVSHDGCFQGINWKHALGRLFFLKL